MALKYGQYYRGAEKTAAAPTGQAPAPAVATGTPVKAPAGGDRSFAVFAVSGEWFCVDLDSTLEILHSFNVVSVPHLPETFSGVTNLRGESVPVVDMKKLLKVSEDRSTENICLIMKIDGAKIGFLISSEVEIVNSNQGKIYPLPGCYTRDEARFLEAIFWSGNRFIGMVRPKEALEVLTNWEPRPNPCPAQSDGENEEGGKK